eukprot:766045-Hanusia_phi.AAC.2
MAHLSSVNERGDFNQWLQTNRALQSDLVRLFHASLPSRVQFHYIRAMLRKIPQWQMFVSDDFKCKRRHYPGGCEKVSRPGVVDDAGAALAATGVAAGVGAAEADPSVGCCEAEAELVPLWLNGVGHCAVGYEAWDDLLS